MPSSTASAVGDDGQGRMVSLDVGFEVLPPSALDCRAAVLALEKPLCEVAGKILFPKYCIAAVSTTASLHSPLVTR